MRFVRRESSLAPNKIVEPKQNEPHLLNPTVISIIPGAVVLVLLFAAPAFADNPGLQPGVDGQPQVQLYFFWSLTCPHCTAAHPHIRAIPETRPWVRLHELELSRQPENVARFQALASQVGGEAAAVPSFLFCGEMLSGWDSPQTTGAELLRGLDACHAQATATATSASPPTAPMLTTSPRRGSNVLPASSAASAMPC